MWKTRVLAILSLPSCFSSLCKELVYHRLSFIELKYSGISKPGPNPYKLISTYLCVLYNFPFPNPLALIFLPLHALPSPSHSLLAKSQTSFSYRSYEGWMLCKMPYEKRAIYQQKGWRKIRDVWRMVLLKSRYGHGIRNTVEPSMTWVDSTPLYKRETEFTKLVPLKESRDPRA